MKIPPLHPKLGHLSEEERKRLYATYKEKTLVQISEEFGLDKNISKIHELFEPKVIEETCEYCNTHLWQYYTPKLSKEEYRYRYCPNCEHITHEHRNIGCYCSTCAAKREEEQRLERERLQQEKEQKLKKYREMLENEVYEERDLDELSMLEILYLAVFLKTKEHGIEIRKLMPYRDIYDNMVSTREMRDDIIETLLSSHIIVVEQDIDIEVYKKYVECNDIHSLLEKGKLRVNVKEYHLKRSELIDRLKETLANDKEQAVKLWKKICQHECIQFLLNKTEDVDLLPRMGENTKIMLKERLDSFSVIQMMAVIKKMVGSNYYDYKTGSKDKLYASNSVISGIVRYTQSSIDNDWTVSSFGIDKYELGVTSIMNKILFYDVLEIGDAWFEQIPSISHIA